MNTNTNTTNTNRTFSDCIELAPAVMADARRTYDRITRTEPQYRSREQFAICLKDAWTRAGLDAVEIWMGMSDDERAALVSGMLYAAAAKTTARVSNPDRIFAFLRNCHDRDDLMQDTYLRVLEALASGKIYTADGQPRAIAQIVYKAANAAIAKHWRTTYAHPSAALTATDDNGDEYCIIDTQARVATAAPIQPEAAAIIVDTIERAVPDPVDRRIFAQRAAGYKLREIAPGVGLSTAAVSRRISAAQERAKAASK